MTAESYLDGRVTLHKGDCLDVLKALPEASVDSVVTDPPYGLEFMGKEWDGADGFRRSLNATDVGRDNVFGRASARGPEYRAGGLFQEWCEAWARECLRVLKPGGHLLAFGSTRTYHRLACAIEDAGFEIRDQLAWVYGSGFNKVGYIRDRDGEIVRDGWGGSLKPAWEPIVLARKPVTGTVAENLVKHGTGALNINGCRIASDGGVHRNGEPSQIRRYDKEGGTNFAALPGPRGGDPLGRWPANILHDGSDEVLACFPDSDGQQGDVRGSEPSRTGDANTNCYGEYGRIPFGARGDSGSAARFFYTSKADADDRIGSKHPTVKPLDLMQYLVRLVTPKGGICLDPFAGTGTTGEAAWREGVRAILIERDPEYQGDIARRMDLATQPTKRAAVAKTKNKLADPNALPLFAGGTE